MDKEKPVKEEGLQPTSAEGFRKRFQLGKVITSPTGTVYRIRPIAPHFYLGSWTSQILQFIPDERKKEMLEGGKDLTDEELEKYVPAEERLNVGKAIRPVLLEGVIDPVIIDAKKEKRKPDRSKNELDIDELLAVMDEALFLFNNIHLLSRGNARSGDSFPGDDKGNGDPVLSNGEGVRQASK